MSPLESTPSSWPSYEQQAETIKERYEQQGFTVKEAWYAIINEVDDEGASVNMVEVESGIDAPPTFLATINLSQFEDCLDQLTAGNIFCITIYTDPSETELQHGIDFLQPMELTAEQLAVAFARAQLRRQALNSRNAAPGMD